MPHRILERVAILHVGNPLVPVLAVMSTDVRSRHERFFEIQSQRSLERVVALVFLALLGQSPIVDQKYRHRPRSRRHEGGDAVPRQADRANGQNQLQTGRVDVEVASDRLGRMTDYGQINRDLPVSPSGDRQPLADASGQEVRQATRKPLETASRLIRWYSRSTTLGSGRWPTTMLVQSAGWSWGLAIKSPCLSSWHDGHNPNVFPGE